MAKSPEGCTAPDNRQKADFVRTWRERKDTGVRVLFLSRSSSDGGAETHSLEILHRLNYDSVEPTVLCFGEDFFSKRLSAKAQRHVTVAKAAFPVCFSFRGFVAHWRELRRHRPDTIVVISGSPEAFPWLTYLAAKLIVANRLVSFEHTIVAEPPDSPCRKKSLLRRWFGWRTRLIWRQRLKGVLADRTICVSQAVADALVHSFRYSRSKTAVIRNGVDLILFKQLREERTTLRTEHKLAEGDVLMVCVCRLNREKRIDMLLRALSACHASRPWKCLILGAGPLEQVLKDQSTELSLGEHVFFLGYVDDPTPYLQVADIFVLTSEREGMPLALLEAMAYGLPCVVTDVGGNREVITDGENGFLVPFGNHRDIATKLESLIADPDRRRKMGAKARETVEKMHDLGACVDRIIEELVPDYARSSNGTP